MFVKEASCQAEKCINCEGPHSTFDRSCLAFRKASEILKKMTLDNLSYMEAYRIINKSWNFKDTPRSILKSAQDFHLLSISQPSLSIFQMRIFLFCRKRGYLQLIMF